MEKTKQRNRTQR